MTSLVQIHIVYAAHREMRYKENPYKGHGLDMFYENLQLHEHLLNSRFIQIRVQIILCLLYAL